MKKYGIIAVLGMMIVAGCVTNISGIRVYDPADYGAVHDGQTLCTATIQKAIDECSKHGGGVVRLSGGQFLSGTIFMKSGVTLDLSEDSTLLGSTNLNHYPVTIPEFRSYTDNYTVRSLIYGENLTNIAITGKGTIDGQGKYFKGSQKVRPYGIRFITCQNVQVENVTLMNSAMWMQHYLACDNVTIRGIKVWNHRNKNNDGIDIDSCHNVLIKDCVIDSDDDGITLKSTSARACENITIENCVVSSHCNAIKFGTESNGGFKNIKVSRCVIRPSADRSKIYGRPDGLAGIALEIVDGGIMDQVTISDIQIQGTISPVFIRLGNRARQFKKNMPQPGIGKLRNVTISNIKVSGAGVMGCAIAGLKDHPIENLTFKNLSISFAGGGGKEDSIRRFDEKAKEYPECRMFADRLPAYGLYFWHVNGLKLENVKLTTKKPDERAAIVMEDVSNIVIDGKAMLNSQDFPQGIHFQKFENRTNGVEKDAYLDISSNNFQMLQLKNPVFPDRIFDVRKYGAASDGKTKNTKAFRKAIAECAKTGGGTVLIPKGVWLTGKIHLKSNINLHVVEGAEVRFSQDPADYLPVVFTRWEGIECYNYSPLIYAKDCENIAITGKGVFNGQGKSWWPWKNKQHPAAQRLYDSEYNKIPVKDRIYGTKEAALRPPMIQLISCRRVLLEGYTSRNSPFWNHHLVYCDGVIVSNIVLLNPHDAPNTDGINIDSSRNVHIQGLFADVGDDAVCIKSGMNEDGWRVGRKSENIIIENCHVKNGHGGIVFGSDTSGGIRNVYVHNCVYDGTDIGIRLKSMRGRGGSIENIRIENIQMNNVGSCILLNMFYGSSSAKARSNTPPEFKNIFIKNITGKGDLTRHAVTLRGLPERPIDNVVLENITINSKYGMSASNSQNIKLINVKLIPQKSPVIMLDDCRNVDIIGSVSPIIKTFLQLKGSNTARINLAENDLTFAVNKIVKEKKVPADAVIYKD